MLVVGFALGGLYVTSCDEPTGGAVFFVGIEREMLFRVGVCHRAVAAVFADDGTGGVVCVALLQARCAAVCCVCW